MVRKLRAALRRPGLSGTVRARGTNRRIASLLAIAVQWTAASMAYAQNLVPNPSFETYTLCPTTYSQLNQAPPWSPPTNGSPDYFNACAGSPATMGVPDNDFGIQAAHTGNGYAGFILRPSNANYREYIQAPLTSPLTANVTYEVSFYVSLSDESQRAIDKIGAYLSLGPVGPVNNAQPLPITPQINHPFGNYITNKTMWTLVSGTYVAVGGEDHIVIGNFYSDASTTPVVGLGGFYPGSYYYIDDVSVRTLNCEALPDGSGCTESCSNPDATCRPSKVIHDPSTGEITVIECGCDCFMRRNDVPPFEPLFCTGGLCRATGEPCELRATPQPGAATIMYDCCADCSQPPQACCLPFFQCADDDPLCCTEDGGVPAGSGTSCSQPEECCYSDGSNQIQDPACCDLTGGTPQGPGTGNVSLAPGACCLPITSPLGTCVVMNPYCCEDLGGTFLGFFTECLGDNDGNGIDDACPSACEPNEAKTACEGSCPSTDCPPIPPGFVPLNVCGTLEDGVTTGCVIFRSQGTTSNQYEVLNPAALTPFGVGDKLRVCGYVNNTNPTTCQQGTPIVVTAVMACDAGENCQPRCLRHNVTTGQIQVLDCECRGPKPCRAVVGEDGVLCSGRCPTGKACHRTITSSTDPVTGDLYRDVCCDCEDVCPLPEPPQPLDPCRGSFQAQGCVDGEEDDLCVPHCANLISNDFCPPTPPNLTGCDCACAAPGSCGPISVTGVGTPYYWNGFEFYPDYLLSCPGECPAPEGRICQLFHKGSQQTTYNPVGVASELASCLPAGFVACDCVLPPSCEPNATGTACQGTCAAGVPCQPTAVTCSGTNCVIAECQCIGGTLCHAVFPPPSSGPTCQGSCTSSSDTCQSRTMAHHPNGSTTVGCCCRGPQGCGDPDGDIDLKDFGGFQNCFTGANGAMLDGCTSADWDQDKDVDLFDFVHFRGALMGAF